MNKIYAVVIILMTVYIISGCGKVDSLSTEYDTITEELSEEKDITTEAVRIDYDIDNILANQKIIFIMSQGFWSEGYATGYFIDAQGKKHIYQLYEHRPFESIEEEYAYLMEHYDEFETKAYFDDVTLKKCIDALYRVNKDSQITTGGQVIFDCETSQLYGIRFINGKEEFVWLRYDAGDTAVLDDPSAELIYKEFGENWKRN